MWQGYGSKVTDGVITKWRVRNVISGTKDYIMVSKPRSTHQNFPVRPEIRAPSAVVIFVISSRMLNG